MKDDSGRPQEVTVGYRINNGLCCDLDEELGEHAVAARLTSGYIQQNVSIVKITKKEKKRKKDWDWSTVKMTKVIITTRSCGQYLSDMGLQPGMASLLRV